MSERKSAILNDQMSKLAGVVYPVILLTNDTKTVKWPVFILTVVEEIRSYAMEKDMCFF